eukprot:gene15905-16082_t
MAEHRACKSGAYTDTDAWAASRTTATWWAYRALAWNMPFHVEHHAWPSVPFHQLPALHRAVVEGAAAPPSGCDPDGGAGYGAGAREL